MALTKISSVQMPELVISLFRSSPAEVRHFDTGILVCVIGVNFKASFLPKYPSPPPDLHIAGNSFFYRISTHKMVLKKIGKKKFHPPQKDYFPQFLQSSSLKLTDSMLNVQCSPLASDKISGLKILKVFLGQDATS